MATTRRTFLRDSTLITSTFAASGLIAGSAYVNGAEAGAGRVKVGLVGTGHPHALGKLAALLRMTDLFDVVGVVEPDDKRRNVLMKHAEFAAVPLPTEEQLLNVPGLAAVLVDTPVKDIVATATRIAPAGVHIHAEKPCGPSLPAFLKLQEIVKQKGRILQLGYMLRRNPAFEICFRAVREGWLGDVYEIHAIMGKVLNPAERKEIAFFPGGIMYELGCHMIDAMVGFLGRPAAVQSFLRRTHPQLDDLADNTLAVCEYPGALATIRSAAIDIEGNARRSFVICGDRGAATILPLEAPKLTLTLTKPEGGYKKGTQAVELRKMPGRYDDQLADFARIIRGEKELDYKPEHDLAVLETVLKACGMPVT